MVDRRTKQEVMMMINKLKQWLSKHLSITIVFNRVDIDTVDYEGGYVATTTTPEGINITVYEREDRFCSDPVFAYNWEKNCNGVVTTGSCRVSYYKLKGYKFKLVKLPTFDEWYRGLLTKEAKAIKLWREQNPAKEVSNAYIAKMIKEGKV